MVQYSLVGAEGTLITIPLGRMRKFKNGCLPVSANTPAVVNVIRPVSRLDYWTLARQTAPVSPRYTSAAQTITAPTSLFRTAGDHRSQYNSETHHWKVRVGLYVLLETCPVTLRETGLTCGSNVQRNSSSIPSPVCTRRHRSDKTAWLSIHMDRFTLYHPGLRRRHLPRDRLHG